MLGLVCFKMISNWALLCVQLELAHTLKHRDTLALSAEPGRWGAGCLHMLASDSGLFYRSLINLLLHLQVDEWVQGRRGNGADTKGITVGASLCATVRGGKESPNTETDRLGQTTEVHLPNYCHRYNF